MMDTSSPLKWIGTTTGVVGALLVAMNIPQSGYGFLLFLVSSISWFIAAYRMREISLMILQAVFTVINLVGVWRWLFAN
ncbi:nicotinamide mononucleotide transporter [Candidatus Magnetaquicoccus inordinatus]|uniref:nicotinamide mononucleotide transporter n=1 Tax=Candidatus Magnetaquicoccus inordinatus TaxID=2496818 RepID=UPI00102B5153|nr:nicotinamide mononucleotide transporter [Candidatus Magnetaquicoccus inordinatus]